MDAEQFAQFMGKFQTLIGLIENRLPPAGNVPAAAAAVVAEPVLPAVGRAAVASIPLPPPLELEGDMEENFNFFEKNWETYASAIGMDEWPDEQNKQKASILLSVVGRDALKKYFNFELSAAEREDPELVLAAIKAKVVRERNKFVDWFDFFSLNQEDAESIDDYLCRLKTLAKVCKFGNLKQEMVKYKLATSVKWLKLRSKLITTKNLTEAIAVDLCRAEEIAERHPATVGQPSGEVQQTVEVNAVKKSKLKCKFCGGKHDFTKGACPALGKKCNRCGGKNHFEIVCKADRRKKLRKKKLRVKKVNEQTSSDSGSEESDSEEEWSESESASIGKIVDKSGSGGNVLAELEIRLDGKWQHAQCELDTGANASLVGLNWLKEMTGRDKVRLQPSSYRLQGFGGANIPVVGQVKIPCRRKGRKYKLVLQVVDVPHGPLLSANVCRILGFVKFCNTVNFVAPKTEQELLNIYRVKAQDIVCQHEEVFRGTGKFAGAVSLEVRPEVPPCIQPPRRIPIEMRGMLKDELKNLERHGLIVKENAVADAISQGSVDERQTDYGFHKRDIHKVFREIEEVKLSSFLKVKDEQLNEIIEETSADPSMQLFVRYILDGWPTTVDKVPDSTKMFFKYKDELSTQDGIVYRNDRIVVPYALRRKLTEKVHVSHNGIEATLKLAQANLFWPGMSAQIKEAVQQCHICAKFCPSQPPAPMQSHPIPLHPFQLVSMDVFFADYQEKSCKFLVTVDHFSDFFEVDLLKDLTPKSTIAVCKSNFSRHGKPQRVVTDNGTNFVNREWQQFAKEWSFEHATSAPHHQQANGKAEAAVKIAKRLLKKAEEAGSDFWYALLHWRNVPNKVGTSPPA